MQTLHPVFPLLAWCLELHALQHRPEQTPWSVQAEFYHVTSRAVLSMVLSSETIRTLLKVLAF